MRTLLCAIGVTFLAGNSAHGQDAGSAIKGTFDALTTYGITFGKMEIGDGFIQFAAGMRLDGLVIVEQKGAVLFSVTGVQDMEALPNPLCEPSPGAIIFSNAVDDHFGPVLLMQAYLGQVSSLEDLAAAGPPCNELMWIPSDVTIDEAAAVSDNDRAQVTCEQAFQSRPGDQLRCLSLELNAIRETDKLRSTSEGDAAWTECVSLLRGAGSMDFNPSYVYFECAKNPVRKTVRDECIRELDAFVQGNDYISRNGKPIFRDEVVACHAKKLGILW